MERHLHRLEAALADGVGPAGEIDADREADRADVEHVGQSLQAHRGLRPERLQLFGALEQVLLAIEIERGEAGGAGERMRRISIAVEQLDDVFGPAHEGVVDALAHQHAAHRHRARRDALGKRDHVGDDAIALGGEGIAEAAEAGDHLVEDQQDAVLVADRAQPLRDSLSAAAARRSRPRPARR